MTEQSYHEHERTIIPVDGDDEVTRIPIVSELTIVAGILILLLGGAIVPRFFFTGDDSTPPALGAQTFQSVTASFTEANPDAFADVALLADAAFVLDVRTQRVLFQQNPDEQLPLASLTKLMTALVAYEVLESDEAVAITTEALRQDGGGLYERETFDRQTLLDLVLVTSSNDGAFALADAAGRVLGGDASTFVQAMNIKAEALSLSQTFYRNPTGLDVSTHEAGAYGSARDTAFLMQHILSTYPAILERTTSPRSYIENQAGAARTAYNTNQYVNDIPGIIGSKTGYTDLAGGNLAVAFNAAVDRPVIVVVLGSTRAGRFSDVEKLVAAAQASLQ